MQKMYTIGPKNGLSPHSRGREQLAFGLCSFVTLCGTKQQSQTNRARLEVPQACRAGHGK
jgi:hypothetical protein